jgi:hypothetical protein
MLSHYDDSIYLQNSIIHKPNGGEERHSTIKGWFVLSYKNY